MKIHSLKKGFLPEVISSEPNHYILEAQEDWRNLFRSNEGAGEDVVETTLPEDLSVQALWDQPICEQKYQQLLSAQTTPTERSCLIAVASPHASDWLAALPSANLGLKLDNTAMRLATGLRLGASIVHPHKCRCGTVVDSLGRHGLSCKYAKGTYPRHLEINMILERKLGKANATAS